jgi:uncharacterized protein YchJ
MHERARFVREEGAWRYLDGEVSVRQVQPAGDTAPARATRQTVKRCTWDVP